jgi:hypothetical protein
MTRRLANYELDGLEYQTRRTSPMVIDRDDLVALLDEVRESRKVTATVEERVAAGCCMSCFGSGVKTIGLLDAEGPERVACDHNAALRQQLRGRS